MSFGSYYYGLFIHFTQQSSLNSAEEVYNQPELW
jgi:hypothetical protein